jgi:transposase-like protein
MDGKTFLGWVSLVDDLTDVQRAATMAILAGRLHEGAASAAIELAVAAGRPCPHCHTPGAENRGMAHGLRRYRCKACGKSFNALTATPLSRLRHKDRWLAFGQSLAEGETVDQAAGRCGVAHSTAFRWRHRFLKAAKPAGEMLGGIVEADEIFVLSSRKGSQEWKRAERGQSVTDLPNRKARKRGGKASKRGLSHELVPVLVAVDRSGATISAVLPTASGDAIKAVLDPVLSQDALLVTDGGKALASCATKMKVTHEVLNQSNGEHVRGDLHIQTVNSRHERLKTFLRTHRGIAAKPPALPVVYDLLDQQARPKEKSMSDQTPAPTPVPLLDLKALPGNGQVKARRRSGRGRQTCPASP